MSIDLIIFDLDGTIVDSCEDITVAINFCLRKYGMLEFTQEEVKKMIGEGVRKFVEKVIHIRNLSHDLLNDIFDCFVSYYSNHVAVFT